MWPSAGQQLSTCPISLWGCFRGGSWALPGGQLFCPSCQEERSSCSPAAQSAHFAALTLCCAVQVAGRTWVDDYNLRSQHLPMISAAGMWLERRKVRLPDADFFSRNFRPLPTGSYR